MRRHRNLRRRPAKVITQKGAWTVAYRTVLFSIAVLLGLWFFRKLEHVVVILTLSTIIAAAMTPLVERVRHPIPLGFGKIWTPNKAIIALALYLVVLLFAVAIGALVIPPMISDMAHFVAGLPQRLEGVQGWLDNTLGTYPLLDSTGLGSSLGNNTGFGVGQVTGFARSFMTGVMNVMRVITGVFSFTLDFILVLILAVWLTSSSTGVRQYFLGFLPRKHQTHAESLTSRIGDRLGGWLRGQIVLSAIIGAMALVGLLALGVPAAFLLAFIAAIGEAIPILGPVISAVPAIIAGSTISLTKGLLVLGLYIVIQQAENHLIVPNVMQRAVKVHPLAVIVALLIGAQLYGIMGAILSVPVAAAFSVIVNEIRDDIRENDTSHRVGPRIKRKEQPHEKEMELANKIDSGEVLEKEAIQDGEIAPPDDQQPQHKAA